MSKPYDAASKELLQIDPAAWAAFVGVPRPPERVKLTDSDLSAVTAAADKVILIEDAPRWRLDIEFQSWRDPSLPRQLLKYNALLQDRHKCAVASVLIVLAEDADSPAAIPSRHPSARRGNSVILSFGCGRRLPPSSWPVRWRSSRWPQSRTSSSMKSPTCCGGWRNGRVGSRTPKQPTASSPRPAFYCD